MTQHLPHLHLWSRATTGLNNLNIFKIIKSNIQVIVCAGPVEPSFFKNLYKFKDGSLSARLPRGTKREASYKISVSYKNITI